MFYIQTKKFNCIDIKPAYGSGETEIRIDDLIIQDKRDCEVLNKLLLMIQELTGQQIRKINRIR